MMMLSLDAEQITLRNKMQRSAAQLKGSLAAVKKHPTSRFYLGELESARRSFLDDSREFLVAIGQLPGSSGW